MPSISVVQGHSYIGGADRPRVFVSKETVRAELVALGFDRVVVFDRTEWEQKFRENGGIPDVIASLPGFAGDTWNTVAQGVRVGPSLDLPVPVGPAWLLDFPPAMQPELPGPAPAPAREPTAASSPAWVGPVAVLGVGLVGAVGAAVLSWRSVRRWKSP